MAAVGRIQNRLHTKLLQVYKTSKGFKINATLKARLHHQRQILVQLCGLLKYNDQVDNCTSNAINLSLKCCRCMSGGSVQETEMSVHQPVNPYKLVETELASLCVEIKQEVITNKHELGEIAEYYFDGKGKAFRPMLVMLASKALNYHKTEEEKLLDSQRRVAMIAEMIHSASLIHDDVIDESYIRRGKSSVNNIWKERKAILAGNYVLSIASMALARIGNKDVVQVLSQTIEDLVRGEFMQLGSKEDENERFKHYLTKTFKKTASLMANSCKAIAVLGELDEDLIKIAYEYGRNIGISFQFRVNNNHQSELTAAYSLRDTMEVLASKLDPGRYKAAEVQCDRFWLLVISTPTPGLALDKISMQVEIALFLVLKITPSCLSDLSEDMKLILVDDILDFTSCDNVMGKPTAADLSLGLATAPVLFAAQEFPELHSMIMRRFRQEGDVERARELVAKSDGVSHTRIMAEQHCKEAVRLIQTLKSSVSKRAMEHTAYLVLNRQK